MNQFCPKPYKGFLIIALGLSIQSQLSAQTWTLKACIARANDKNIALNQTKLSNDLNRITLDQSKYNLYPNLNLSDAQIFSFGRSLDPISYQYSNENISSNSPSLNSSVTLYSGLHNIYLIHENKLIYNAGSLDIEKQQNDLDLSVLGAYMQVLLTYEALDIAKKQMEMTAAQVDRTEKFVNAGKVPELNLFQVQSQLATDKSAIVDAENSLQIAKVTLMQLMELPITPNFEIEKPALEGVLTEASATSAEDVYNRALVLQPQIKSAVMHSEAAQLDLKVSQSAIQPTLSMGGSLRTNYSSLRNEVSSQVIYEKENVGYVLGNPSQPVVGLVPTDVTTTSGYPIENQLKDNFNQAISFTLSVPLFNNYQVKYAIEKSKVSVQNAKLNEDAASVQLRKVIEQAYTDWAGAAKKLVAAEEQAKSEERTYGDMEKKFTAGLATTTDYLVEKNNYTKSLLAKESARYDYVYKTKVIDFYLGNPLTF